MLFVSNVPSGPRLSPLPQSWQEFTRFIQNELQQFSGVEQLGDKVWLVNMSIDPVPLGLLVAGAHKHGVPFRLLPFGDEPQWLGGSAP